MKNFRSFFFLIFIGVLTACNEAVLLQELDQHDANAILVVLAKNGIKAEKKAIEKQQAVTWTITVSGGNEQAARELLVVNNLPKQKQLGLSGVCKDTGLIPTPKMEKCREMLALKGEIINSLESIPGVVDADAVVNIPDKEDFPDANTPVMRPSASVVVQIDPALKESPVEEGKVQQFVANAVTGMDVHDVAVIITRGTGGASFDNVDRGGGSPVVPSTVPAPVTAQQNSSGEVESNVDLTKVAGLEMDSQSAKKFKVVFSLVLVFFIGLATALILVLVKMAQIRKTPGTNVMTNPALPEKVTMDRLVEETGGDKKS